MDQAPVELLCTICYQLYDQPVTLPCRHSFCRDCITQCLEVIIFLPKIQLNKCCPICRRVFCLLLDEELPIDENLQKLVNDVKQASDPSEIQVPQAQYEPICVDWSTHPTIQEGLPVFCYDIGIPLNGYAAFNFFEPRYLMMIAISVKKNLMFAIYSGQTYKEHHYCDIVKIIDVEPVRSQNTYTCQVQKVDRARMKTQWKKDVNTPSIEFMGFKISNTSRGNYPLLFTIPEKILDKVDLSEEENLLLKSTYKQFWQAIDDLEMAHLKSIVLKAIPKIESAVTEIEELRKLRAQLQEQQKLIDAQQVEGKMDEMQSKIDEIEKIDEKESLPTNMDLETQCDQVQQDQMEQMLEQNQQLFEPMEQLLEQKDQQPLQQQNQPVQQNDQPVEQKGIESTNVGIFQNIVPLTKPEINKLSQFSLWFVSLMSGAPNHIYYPLYYGTDINERFKFFVEQGAEFIIAMSCRALMMNAV